MSKTTIPKEVMIELWVRAGGRCEKRGCNRYLVESTTAPEKFNGSEIAHVIADSPKGPRGIDDASKERNIDINNLMLLCPTCHREIDKKENLDYFTPELLFEMKQEHEKRIFEVTAIATNRDSQILTYYAGIGDSSNYFKENRIKHDILTAGYCSSEPIINLSMNNKYDQDDERCYWEAEERHLMGLFNRQVRPLIEDNKIERLLVFTMAPIPLMVKLGTLLDDKLTSVIFQKQRTPDTWNWSEEEKYFNKHQVFYPKVKTSNNIALNISLSGTITNDRILPFFENDVDICTISVDSPSPNYLKTQEQLDDFVNVYMETLDKLKEIYGQNNQLHVFPACPISVAVEMGRRWLKKCDLTLIIYDQNNNRKEFIQAITVDGKYGK